jgi:hypothetical protein
MGVSAEKQAKAGVGCLLVDLWSMRQKDRKTPEGDSGRGLLDAVDAIKMRVIDTSQVNALIITLNYMIFV